MPSASAESGTVLKVSDARRLPQSISIAAIWKPRPNVNKESCMQTIRLLPPPGCALRFPLAVMMREEPLLLPCQRHAKTNDPSEKQDRDEHPIKFLHPDTEKTNAA